MTRRTSYDHHRHDNDDSRASKGRPGHRRCAARRRCVPGSLQRPHVGRVPARPARVLPLGGGHAAHRLGGHPSAHRVVPQLDGGARLGGIDDRRRRSTVCGFYRFAHIDGRIVANPAQYVRRPKVRPSEGHGMDRAELGTFLFTAERFDRDHAALAVLLGLNGLRVSEACGTNIEDLALQRGHRGLRILGKGNQPATIPLVPRTARTIDLVVGERHEGPILRRKDGQRLDRRTGIAGSVRSASARVSEWSIHTCSAPGSSWPRSTPECPDAMYRSPPATPTRRLRRRRVRRRRVTPPTPQAALLGQRSSSLALVRWRCSRTPSRER